MDLGSHPCLNQVLILLQVERSLVLQPSPVILDATNLLAVVIRNRVLRAGRRRVGTVLLDPGVEDLLFLYFPS